MDKSAKLSGPDDFDKYISAELPDEKKYPELHRLVCKHMMHGPCGVLNKKLWMHGRWSMSFQISSSVL